MSKNVLVFLAILFVIAVAASCKKSKNVSARHSLITGTWKVSGWVIDSNNNGVMDEKAIMFYNLNYETYIFNSDGSAQIISHVISDTDKITWSLEHNDTYLQIDYPDPYSVPTHHRIDSFASSYMALADTYSVPHQWEIIMKR